MPFTTSEIDGTVGFVVNPESGCNAGLAVDLTDAPVGLIKSLFLFYFLTGFSFYSYE